MKYLGDYSATPPQYSRHMECYKCQVSWTGCWDNFMCPKCGEGELPNNDFVAEETITAISEVMRGKGEK